MTENLPGTPPKRVTIEAVARRAGVSASAVSHAFNGRPNISAATAARIMRAADELNWRPHFASRKVTGRGGLTVGLVIARSSANFERDPFFMRLVAGLSARLSEIGGALALTLVHADDEERTYVQWSAEQRVDGFLLVDLRADDPRTALVRRLGVPAVALGSPVADDIPAVSVDGDASGEVLAHLAVLGHRVVARVDDGPGLLHTRSRAERFTAAAHQHGVRPVLLSWDRAAPDPVAAVLAAREGATALVVDNESVAVEIVAHAPEVGLRVPEQLSVVAWEDSWVCHLVRPRVTALDAPVEESARTAVAVLQQLLAGTPAASRTVGPRRLVVRDSTAPPTSQSPTR